MAGDALRWAAFACLRRRAGPAWPPPLCERTTPGPGMLCGHRQHHQATRRTTALHARWRAVCRRALLPSPLPSAPDPRCPDCRGAGIRAGLAPGAPRLQSRRGLPPLCTCTPPRAHQHTVITLAAMQVARRAPTAPRPSPLPRRPPTPAAAAMGSVASTSHDAGPLAVAVNAFGSKLFEQLPADDKVRF